MLSKNLKEVTWKHIEALVAEGASEGKEIEFKQVLPGKTDTDKNEFLADVTAFANAGGVISSMASAMRKGPPRRSLG